MHVFRWDTLTSDQFTGAKVPVLITDRLQTVLLGLLIDLAVNQGVYFSDYDGNEEVIQDFIDDAISRILKKKSAMAIGTVMPMATTALPEDCLYCDGNSYLKADYPELWNAITTFWGTSVLGDDYFVVPDFRGYFLLGYRSGEAAPPYFASEGGEQAVTLDVGDLPAHHHLYGLGAVSGTVKTGAVYGYGSYYEDPRAQTDDTGGNTSHNNMPPYKAVNYVIQAR